jgi:hypothetical protein
MDACIQELIQYVEPIGSDVQGPANLGKHRESRIPCPLGGQDVCQYWIHDDDASTDIDKAMNLPQQKYELRHSLRSRSRSSSARSLHAFEFPRADCRKSNAAKAVEHEEWLAGSTHRAGHPTDQAQTLYRLVAFLAELAVRQTLNPRIEIQTSCSDKVELRQDRAMPYLEVVMQEVEVAQIDHWDERGIRARAGLFVAWTRFCRALQDVDMLDISKLARSRVRDLAARFAGFVRARAPCSEKPLVRYLLSTHAFHVHAKSAERFLERKAAKLQ